MNSLISILIGVAYIIPTIYLVGASRWRVPILLLNSAVPIGLGLVVAQFLSGPGAADVGLNVTYAVALAIWLSTLAFVVCKKLVT